jgi:hypothetical protein
MLLIASGLLLVAGCASLPDPKKIEANSDAMTYYSGVMAASGTTMAHNMGRITNASERMQRKAAPALDAGTKATAKIESAVKTHLDAKREGTRGMDAVYQELRDLKGSLRGAPAPGKTEGDIRVRERINARVRELEDRLEALSKRIERSPNAR